MKVNFNVELTGLDKKPIIENGETLTIKDAVVATLMRQSNEKIGGLEKEKCFKLAQKIYNAKGELELDLTEASAIKVMSEHFQNVLIYGRICEALDK